MIYVYVLRSQKDKRLYYGQSDDLGRRIIEHNNGNVKSTVNRRPLVLVDYETVKNREEALKREKFFKSGIGRNYVKNKLKVLDGPIV